MSIKSKLQFKYQCYVNDVLYASAFKKHRLPNKEKMILCYHGIDKKGNTSFNSKFLSQNYFEKQLCYFRQHFNVLSLQEIMSDEAPPVSNKKLSIALTFDDGYKNNFKYAFPLLKKYNLPATFFITAINETEEKMLLGDCFDLLNHHFHQPIEFGNEVFKKNWRGHYKSSTTGKSLKAIFHRLKFVEKQRLIAAFPTTLRHQLEENPLLFDYWEQMNEQEIETLAQSDLVTIGSHGYHHNNLTVLDLQDAKKEMYDSKAYLENIIQQPVVDFAFPYGSYTEELVEECADLGFQSALSLDYLTKYRTKTLHNRFGMNPYMSWNNQLHFLIQGNYDI